MQTKQLTSHTLKIVLQLRSTFWQGFDGADDTCTYVCRSVDDADVEADGQGAPEGGDQRGQAEERRPSCQLPTKQKQKAVSTRGIGKYQTTSERSVSEAIMGRLITDSDQNEVSQRKEEQIETPHERVRQQVAG